MSDVKPPVDMLALAKTSAKCIEIAKALHKDGHCGEEKPLEPYCDGCLVDSYIFLHILTAHKEAILECVLRRIT